MNIIKPMKLSLLHKPYRYQSQDYLVVSGMCIFSLLDKNHIYSEMEKIATCYQLLGKDVFDLCMPKKQAEFLAVGSAYSTSGKAIAQREVSVRVGNKSKVLLVKGDQACSNSFINFGKTTEVTKFLKMPITYERACGGAAFGPVGVDWPEKIKQAGTFDANWIEHENPGYPKDIDWRYFNRAADDQMFDTFLKGDETFEITGMHPDLEKIKGSLPGMVIRGFINHKYADQTLYFYEVPMNIDTVWFFPDQEIGVIISRGVIKVSDSEALDVDSLMLCYENMSDTPRSLEYYQDIFAKRSNRETALAHVFNESQLSPEKTPEQHQEIARQRAEYHAKEARKNALEQDALIKDAEARLGLAAGTIKPKNNETENNGTANTIDPSLLLTPDDIRRGDFDLSPYLAAVDKITEQAKAEQTKLESRANELLKDTKDQASQIQLAKIAKDFELARKAAQQRVALQVTGLSDRMASKKLEKTDLSDEKVILLKEHLSRVGRKHAVEPAINDVQDEIAVHLRGIIISFIDSKKDLSGRDFSGADLSGINFSGMNLQEVMLENANLEGCNFSNANLQGAVLTGAKIDHAIFYSANLTEVNLSSVIGKNSIFDGAELSGAKFVNADLQNCSWKSAVFKNNSITQCKLDDGDFSDSSFDMVMIAKSSLSRCNFSSSSWKKLNAIGSDFYESCFKESDFNGGSIVETNLGKSDFSKSTLKRILIAKNSDCTACCFDDVKAFETGWREVNFYGATFYRASFARSDFDHANFSNCNLKEACFYQSLLSGANFRGIEAIKFDAFQSLMRKADFSFAYMPACNLVGADTFETLFNGADIHNAFLSATIKEKFISSAIQERG